MVKERREMSRDAQDKIERAYHGPSVTPPHLLPAPKVAGALPEPPRSAKRVTSTKKSRRSDGQGTRVTDSHQAGQAIVLLALAMIALLAFAALAIDGGQVYWLRRSAQNAADGAAMSAAYAKCTGGDIEAAGLAAAALNDFDEAERPGTTVEIYSPPTSGPLAGDPAYVEAIVTADTPSHLAHFVFEGPLAVTARAIGYCEPVWDGVTGSAIYAGDTGECTNSLTSTLSGADYTGGLHSNNTMAISGHTTLVDGTVSYVNGDQPDEDKVTFVDIDGDGDAGGFNPLASGPVWSTGIYPVNFQTEDFAPGSDEALAAEADDPDGDGIGRYHPYVGLHNFTLKTQDLPEVDGEPFLDGLYYVEGNVSLSGSFVGEVTIVATGKISFSGSHQDISPYVEDGLLLFTEAGADYGGGSRCSTAVISLSGSELVWRGIIYAPNGRIEMSSSDNATLFGTLIGHNVHLSGSTASIIYSDEYLPAENPYVEHVE
jgi:hypothetical protein